jgi:hypothetical protein
VHTQAAKESCITKICRTLRSLEQDCILSITHYIETVCNGITEAECSYKKQLTNVGVDI